MPAYSQDWYQSSKAIKEKQTSDSSNSLGDGVYTWLLHGLPDSEVE